MSRIQPLYDALVSSPPQAPLPESAQRAEVQQLEAELEELLRHLDKKVQALWERDLADDAEEIESRLKKYRAGFAHRPMPTRPDKGDWSDAIETLKFLLTKARESEARAEQILASTPVRPAAASPGLGVAQSPPVGGAGPVTPPAPAASGVEHLAPEAHVTPLYSETRKDVRDSIQDRVDWANNFFSSSVDYEAGISARESLLLTRWWLKEGALAEKRDTALLGFEAAEKAFDKSVRDYRDSNRTAANSRKLGPPLIELQKSIGALQEITTEARAVDELRRRVFHQRCKALEALGSAKGGHGWAVSTINRLRGFSPRANEAASGYETSWQKLGDSDMTPHWIDRLDPMGTVDVQLLLEMQDKLTKSLDDLGAVRRQLNSLKAASRSMDAFEGNKLLDEKVRKLTKDKEGLPHRRDLVNLQNDDPRAFDKLCATPEGLSLIDKVYRKTVEEIVASNSWTGSVMLGLRNTFRLDTNKFLADTFKAQFGVQRFYARKPKVADEQGGYGMENDLVVEPPYVMKLYDAFKKVPESDTCSNASIIGVRHTRIDDGGGYMSDIKVIEVALLNLDAEAEGPDGTKVKNPDGTVAKRFTVTTLHEIGHAVDDKEAYMDSRQEREDHGCWRRESFKSLAQIMVEKALTNEYIRKKVPLTTVTDFCRDVALGGTPKQEEYNDLRGFLILRDEIYTGWFKEVKHGGGNFSRAMDVPWKGRVYLESYENMWWSYKLTLKELKWYRDYQYRAPGEFFADSYAAYYLGNRNTKNPIHEWLKLRHDEPEQKTDGKSG
jgi:hypothetical protein